MFRLDNEMKRKLVKNLSREVRIRDYRFEFEGDCLLCYEEDEFLGNVDLSDLPYKYSFNRLLKDTIECLYNLLKARSIAKDILMKMSYCELVEKIRAVRVKDTGLSKKVVTYKTDDKVFQFISHMVCFDRDGMHEMDIFITPEILETHKVNTETFFQNVKEKFQKEGIDILADIETLEEQI